MPDSVRTMMTRVYCLVKSCHGSVLSNNEHRGRSRSRPRLNHGQSIPYEMTFDAPRTEFASFDLSAMTDALTWQSPAR